MTQTINQNEEAKRGKAAMQAEFLSHLTESLSVTSAAKATGITRQTVYDWLSKSRAFKIKFNAAMQTINAYLEDEAIRRAVHGIDKAIFHQGKKVDTVKEYSDTLLAMLLKSHMPDNYKDRTASDAAFPGIIDDDGPMDLEEAMMINKMLDEKYGVEE